MGGGKEVVYTSNESQPSVLSVILVLLISLCWWHLVCASPQNSSTKDRDIINTDDKMKGCWLLFSGINGYHKYHQLLIRGPAQKLERELTCLEISNNIKQKPAVNVDTRIGFAKELSLDGKRTSSSLR